MCLAIPGGEGKLTAQKAVRQAGHPPPSHPLWGAAQNNEHRGGAQRNHRNAMTWHELGRYLITCTGERFVNFAFSFCGAPARSVRHRVTEVFCKFFFKSRNPDRNPCTAQCTPITFFGGGQESKSLWVLICEVCQHIW